MKQLGKWIGWVWLVAALPSWTQAGATGYLTSDSEVSPSNPLGLVRNSAGECWRTTDWAPELARLECEPAAALSAAEPPVAAAAPAPEPEPSLSDRASREWSSPVLGVMRPMMPPPPMAKAYAEPQLSWQTQLLFSAHSAQLSPDGQQVLAALLVKLVRYPDAHWQLRGSWDDSEQRAKPDPRDLATRRALSVAQWLVMHGVVRDRVLIDARRQLRAGRWVDITVQTGRSGARQGSSVLVR